MLICLAFTLVSWPHASVDLNSITKVSSLLVYAAYKTFRIVRYKRLSLAFAVKQTFLALRSFNTHTNATISNVSRRGTPFQSGSVPNRTLGIYSAKKRVA